jgi:hypothetical protein
MQPVFLFFPLSEFWRTLLASIIGLLRRYADQKSRLECQRRLHYPETLSAPCDPQAWLS